MKNRIIISLFVFIFALGIYAQRPATAIKFAEIGDDRASTYLFTAKIRTFLEVMKKEPVETRGFIAVSGEDSETLMTRVGLAKALVRNDKTLKDRVEISRPGTVYNKRWPKSELWLIPKGADFPYIANTYDFYCPNLSIIGPTSANPRSKTIRYSAELSGGDDDPIRYRWRVTGGKTVSGQDSRVIEVRPFPNAKELSVEVSITGLEERFCVTNVILTTKLSRSLP